MASLIDELITVLTDENTEYQNLILLSHEKTPTIVNGDLEKLQKITEAEQIILGKVTGYEKKRTEVMNDIATVLGQDPKKLKVSGIIELLEKQKEEQERLIDIYGRLKETLKEMSVVNELNRNLVNEAKELVEFDINILKNAFQEPETANYNRDAYSVSDTKGRGVFDAKQ